MSFRIKQEKIAPEIESARSKLEDALQYIIEKADESPCTSEDEFNKVLNELVIKREPSPVSSPAKRSAPRIQRKRRRKDETLLKNANSYVMKLFDRAVDLTPFTEQTPLYPICRAWINNQSLYKSTVTLKEEPASEELSSQDDTLTEENSESVHGLPLPIPIGKKDLRIPSPIPKKEEAMIIRSEGHNVIAREALLASHLVRWKAVRRKWKEAAKANEERYKESAIVLKSMFIKAQCSEEVLSSDPWDGLTSVT